MVKVKLYISMTLDGFIATTDDDISWLHVVEKAGEDYGYQAFGESVDKYVTGRKTYDVVKSLAGEFPPARLYDCYVLSRTKNGTEDGVTFYSGTIEELIGNLRSAGGRDIYCDGGAEIVRELMVKNLIDEYVISVIPLLLGDGKRLFKGGTPPMSLKLMSAKSYDTGLVQLRYCKN